MLRTLVSNGLMAFAAVCVISAVHGEENGAMADEKEHKTGMLPLEERVVHWPFDEDAMPGAVVNEEFARRARDEADGGGLVVDTTGRPDNWTTYVTSRPGMLEGGARYFLRFNYRVLERADDAHFYCLVKSATEQKDNQWAWKGYFSWRGGPGTEGVKEKRIALPDYGDYELVFGVRNEGRMELRDVSLWKVRGITPAMVREATRTEPSEEPWEPFGMCVQTGLPWVYTADDQVREAMSMLEEGGVQWVRLGLAWEFMEREQGVVQTELLDRLDLAVDEALARGITPYIQLLGTPKWASSNPDHVRHWAFTPKDMADWTGHVRLMADRFGDRVDYWEVWNEQDWEFWESPLEDFVPLLKAAADELRRVDPGCKIILGGLATDGSTGWDNPLTEENALQRLYDACARPYFDIMGLHTYPYDLRTGALETVDRVNNTWTIMERNGDGHKPIWVNEVGLTTGGGGKVTPAEQAAFLRDVMTLLPLHPKVDKVFWYNFRCIGVNPDDDQDNYGIVNHDFSPRPAWEVFSTMEKDGPRRVCDLLLERTPPAEDE